MNQAVKIKPVVSAPYARFGLTEEIFAAHLAHRAEVSSVKDAIRQNDEMPFFDWEAKILSEVFATFAHNPDVCGVIATMMQSIKEDYDKRQENKPSNVVPLRKNTIGMMQ